MLTPKRRLGNNGEQIAAEYLQTMGYNILGRQVRFSHLEIDIIARDVQSDLVVFVEVKARARYQEDYPPQMTVTPKKRRLIRKAALQWVQQHDYQGVYRMDIICIVGETVVHHFEGVKW